MAEVTLQMVDDVRTSGTARFIVITDPSKELTAYLIIVPKELVDEWGYRAAILYRNQENPTSFNLYEEYNEGFVAFNQQKRDWGY